MIGVESSEMWDLMFRGGSRAPRVYPIQAESPRAEDGPASVFLCVLREQPAAREPPPDILTSAETLLMQPDSQGRGP